MFNMFSGDKSDQDKQKRKNREKGPMYKLVVKLEEQINQYDIVAPEDRSDRIPAWNHMTTRVIRYNNGDDKGIDNLEAIAKDLDSVSSFFSGDNERSGITQAIKDLHQEINQQISKTKNGLDM